MSLLANLSQVEASAAKLRIDLPLGVNNRLDVGEQSEQAPSACSERRRE